MNYASFVLSCIVMALVSILYRWSLPFFTDFNEFNYHSRMVVLAHLDGIAAGVATALIQRKAIGSFQGDRIAVSNLVGHGDCDHSLVPRRVARFHGVERPANLLF